VRIKEEIHRDKRFFSIFENIFERFQASPCRAGPIDVQNFSSTGRA